MTGDQAAAKALTSASIIDNVRGTVDDVLDALYKDVRR